MPDAGEIRKKTRRIALCGLLGALGAVCMLLGGMIPFATFCCPVLASLALLPAMDECGGAWALGLYAVLSALSLLLAPDRESAALFVFLGYYPLLQRMLCRLRSAPLRMLCKLAVFNLAAAAAAWFLAHVLGIPGPAAERSAQQGWMTAGLLLLGNAVFFLYDAALPRLYGWYARRLRPQLRRRFRL